MLLAGFILIAAGLAVFAARTGLLLDSWMDGEATYGQLIDALIGFAVFIAGLLLMLHAPLPPLN